MESKELIKHILVTGGSGFVGKQVCKLASSKGIPVVSISPSGTPPGINDGEYKTVIWVAADVFDPETWKDYLFDCSAIIHCVGIIEEKPELGITYQKMIYVSAKTAGIAAKAAGVSKFVYISASAGAPETPETYMENKLAAENFLQSLDLDLTILRPGMIYGKEKPETIHENEMIKNLLQDPIIGPQIRPSRPLPVLSVASVALAAAINKSVSGIVSVDDIEKMADNIEIFI